VRKPERPCIGKKGKGTVEMLPMDIEDVGHSAVARDPRAVTLPKAAS